MPSRAKRAPIAYASQFGGGIFRPKDAVEQDLAELEHEEEAPAVAPKDVVDAGDGAEATSPPRHRPQRVRSNERTNIRTTDRPKERIRVRHSFDIWRDQLLALTELQTRTFGATGRKPKLGELVQEALDAYITREQKRTTVRTNERTDG